MKHFQSKLLIGLLLLVSCNMFAQQEPLNTMYMYNGISVNPAYAGTRNTLSITALHRQQWVSMSGAPTTTTLAVHMPIRFTNLSVGASLVSDEIGPVNDIYANFFAAYKIHLSDKLKLSFGMNVGVYSYNAILSGLETGDGETIVDDKHINDYSKVTPNGGAGMYLYNDKFYLGLASPKLFEANLEGFRTDAAELKRHYYLSAGYVFHLGENYAIKPSILSKYVPGAPWTQDFNVQVFIEDKFSLGASYRIDNAVALMAGYHIANKWMLGYSYGIATNNLSSYNSGSHEIVLTYDLRLTKSVVRTPRYYF